MAEDEGGANVVKLRAAIAEREARESIALLSKTSVTVEDLVRFRSWRRDPLNESAYSRVESSAVRR